MSQRISEAEIKTVVFFLFKQKLKVYVPCIPFWFSHRKISKTWAECKIKGSKARQQDSLQNSSNLNIKDNLPIFKTISSFWVDLIANFQGCRNGYFVGKAMTLAEQKKKKKSYHLGRHQDCRLQPIWACGCSFRVTPCLPFKYS